VISVTTRSPLDRFILFWSAFILAITVAGLSAVRPELGSLSVHMLQHTVLMTMLAPVLAVLLHPRSRFCGRRVVALTIVQASVLWIWHAPGIFEIAHHSPGLTVMMHLTLMISALLFWMAVISVSSEAPWKAILALLVSGKLFCMFGALLIFSESGWYAAGHGHGGHGTVTLDDQHIAGLIMVTACPLTYIATAVAIASQWIGSLAQGRLDAPR
jgi:putative membrane protein